MRKVSVVKRCGWKGRGLVKVCRRREYGFAVCLSRGEKKKKGKKRFGLACMTETVPNYAGEVAVVGSQSSARSGRVSVVGG